MSEPTITSAGEQFFKVLFLELEHAVAIEHAIGGTWLEIFTRAFERVAAKTNFAAGTVDSIYAKDWAQRVDQDKFDVFWRSLLFGNWLQTRGVRLNQMIMDSEKQ